MIDEKERTTDSFIDDTKIECLLDQARIKAKDTGYVKRIITKAREYRGLSAEEVAVLLEITDENLLSEMFTAAAQVKQSIYGKRVVMFAPLYISSHCINDCEYCGYRTGNKEQLRRRLTPEEVKEEVKLPV